MAFLKVFSKKKKQGEVAQRRVLDPSFNPCQAIFPALEAYIDRGSLLAAVLNDALARVLDRLGPYSFSANLGAMPKLFTVYSDANPDKCFFATPHIVAVLGTSAGNVTWGWSMHHSVYDPVPRSLRVAGKRDGVPELVQPDIKFPPGWPPRKSKKDDALAVLAHQIGAAAVGIRLVGDARSVPATMRLPPVLSARERNPERKGGIVEDPDDDDEGDGLERPSFVPYEAALALSPYFVGPTPGASGSYSVYLLEFGPSVLRTRRTLAEVAPTLPRLLNNGPPVRDPRESFRGLAQGMGWSVCERVGGHKDDASYDTHDSDSIKDAPTVMSITDDHSRIVVRFDYHGRVLDIKMDLGE